MLGGRLQKNIAFSVKGKAVLRFGIFAVTHVGLPARGKTVNYCGNESLQLN
jgi:hypothetical protein